MKASRAALLVVPLLLVAAACGGSAVSSRSAGSTAAGRGAEYQSGPAPSAVAAPGKPATTGSQPAPLPVPAVPSDRLIRTAAVTLEVRSGRFDSTLERLEAVTAQSGGFVSASTAATTEDRLREGVFTFSVPSDRFEATLASLHDLGTIKAEHLSSQDVAAQYVDLQARLKNAEAQRDAMLAILQQARSVSDIIAVQNQLGQITAQIEQLKGQIGYLDHATAYSTITVTLREAGAPVAATSDVVSLREAAAQGLHAFLQSLGFLVMLLVAVGPYAVVVAGGLYIWRARRAARA